MRKSTYMMKHLYFKQFEGCFFKNKPTIILTIITYEDFSFGIFPKFFGFLLLKFEWFICFERNSYFKSCNESYLLLQTWIWAHLKHLFLSAFGAKHVGFSKSLNGTKIFLKTGQNLQSAFFYFIFEWIIISKFEWWTSA